MDDEARRAFIETVTSPAEDDLARAALWLGRLEHRAIDVERYLVELDALGATAAARLSRIGPGAGTEAKIDALNTLLYEDEGFCGNTERYEDPQNSFLSDVLDRRTGIPISLAVVYLEVARRAGLAIEGINFPGHFLLRWRSGAGDPDGPREWLLDPFHNGAVLSESDCRQLLRQHVGDEMAFDRRLLAPAGKQRIMLRMLTNLKRLYVSMRSYPQARTTVDLLVALDPSNAEELRDRGLLAFHEQDFQGALRDLEAYLHLTPKLPADSEDDRRKEYEEVWEQVKSLRRRVAGLN